MSKRERQSTKQPGSSVPSSRSSPTRSSSSPVFTKRRKLKFGRSPNVVAPHDVDNNNAEARASPRPKPPQSVEPPLRKLDPSVPEEAQRMKTRFKMIEKGKNTVGYDEYLRRIPKRNRRLIPEHPSTPDYTLDMPNRRWQGQVKAWRKALHQYDPKDLSKDLHAVDPSIAVPPTTRPKTNDKKDFTSNATTTIQEEQIAQATTRGLQVDFVDTADDDKNENSNSNSSFKDCTKEGDAQMEEWEKEHEENALVDFEDESDDDLL